MNAITIPVSAEMAAKVKQLADERGVTVETLLADLTIQMVQEFETYKLYLREAERGRGEVSEALELLRRP